MENPILDAQRVPFAFEHSEWAVDAFKAGYRYGQRRYRALRRTNQNLLQSPPPEFCGLGPLVERAWTEGDNAGYLVEFDLHHPHAVTDEEKRAVERDDPDGDLGAGTGLRPAVAMLIVACCVFFAGCCRNCHNAPAAKGEQSSAVEKAAAESRAEIVPANDSEETLTALYGAKLPAPKDVVIPVCHGSYQVTNLIERKTAAHYFATAEAREAERTPAAQHPICQTDLTPPGNEASVPPASSHVSDSINPKMFPPAGTVYTRNTAAECSISGGG